jgi:hypothetical protein
MRVGGVPRAHLLDRGREQIISDEDVCSLGEETKNQPRHEMVHVVPALGASPFGVVFQKLDIEPVQAACRPDVERTFADLFDGGDSGQRQKEAKVVREVPIGTGDRLAGLQVLGLEIRSVCRRINRAFALTVAGLTLSAARVFVTSPGWQVTMWILFV